MVNGMELSSDYRRGGHKYSRFYARIRLRRDLCMRLGLAASYDGHFKELLPWVWEVYCVHGAPIVDMSTSMCDSNL